MSTHCLRNWPSQVASGTRDRTALALLTAYSSLDCNGPRPDSEHRIEEPGQAHTLRVPFPNQHDDTALSPGGINLALTTILEIPGVGSTERGRALCDMSDFCIFGLRQCKARHDALRGSAGMALPSCHSPRITKRRGRPVLSSRHPTAVGVACRELETIKTFNASLCSSFASSRAFWSPLCE